MPVEDTQAVGQHTHKAFPATPAGVAAVRSLRYWRRDPRHVIGLVSIVMMPVIIVGSNYMIVSANGGTSSGGGGGGGGRIAIWRTTDTKAGGTFTANGGGGTSNPPGTIGTIVWGSIPPRGTVITLR